MAPLNDEFYDVLRPQKPLYIMNKSAENESAGCPELNVSVFLPLSLISREIHLVLQTADHCTGWFTQWDPKQWRQAHLRSVTIRGVPRGALPLQARLVPENEFVDLIRLVGLPVSQDCSSNGATFLDVQNVSKCNAAVLLKLLNAMRKNFKGVLFHDFRDNEFSVAFSKFLLRYVTEARFLSHLTLNQCRFDKLLLQSLAPLFNAKDDLLSVDLRRSECRFDAECVLVFADKWKSSIGRHSVKPEKQILTCLESNLEWNKLKKAYGRLHRDRWQNEYISIGHPKGRSSLMLSYEFFDRVRMLRISVCVFDPEAVADWSLQQLFGSLAI
ncbi:hypothetical protein QR680_004188 [Steinernema hermaphroditum]|uniref:Uncharacterized protein n=1 Tax=Steinernema hermaphroditum TaxID=289476 RepID=A0AA39HMW9_9BILA|nr:hypothetical protein QR680_004188 [Steinernema hermaphroditum]